MYEHDDDEDDGRSLGRIAGTAVAALVAIGIGWFVVIGWFVSARAS